MPNFRFPYNVQKEKEMPTEADYRKKARDIASLLPDEQRRNLARFQVEAARDKAESLRKKAQKRGRMQTNSEATGVTGLGSKGNTGAEF